MNIPGYCEQCRRIRTVRVTRFNPAAKVQVGTCTQCETKAEDARRQRHDAPRRGRRPHTP